MQLSWDSEGSGVLGVHRRPEGADACVMTFTVQQAGVSGVEIISSARMCEVFIGEAVGGAIRPSYVCTVKASPVCTVDDELIIDTSVFKLEHCPAGGIPRGRVITLRMLSLLNKEHIIIRDARLLTTTTKTSVDDDAVSLSELGGQVPATSTSQIADIRNMLQEMVMQAESVPGPSSKGQAGDTKNSLIAAIAKSALQKSAASQPQDDSTLLAPLLQRQNTSQSSMNDSIHELVATVQKQGAEIACLTQAVQQLEATCREILQLVVDRGQDRIIMK